MSSSVWMGRKLCLLMDRKSPEASLVPRHRTSPIIMNPLLAKEGMGKSSAKKGTRYSQATFHKSYGKWKAHEKRSNHLSSLPSLLGSFTLLFV